MRTYRSEDCLTTSTATVASHLARAVSWLIHPATPPTMVKRRRPSGFFEPCLPSNFARPALGS